MLRQVDRVGDVAVQKVITPRNKTIGYQVVNMNDHDATKTRIFAKLSAARDAMREQATHLQPA